MSNNCVGLIGLGYWGKILLQKFKKLNYKVYINNSRLDKLSFPKEVRWVFVATPPKTHYKIAYGLLDQGINVFLEKPPCYSHNDYATLIELSKNKNCKLYVNNIFLKRKEIIELDRSFFDSKYIKFEWLKNGPFKNDLISDLIYHDLYILNSFLKIGNLSFEFLTRETNNLHLLGFTKKIKIEFVYNRLSPIIQKSIITEIGKVQILKTKEDPLLHLINDILNYKVNFNENIKINKRSMIMFEKIVNL